MANYYSIKNEPAAAEYIERVGPVICQFMKGKGYEAFAVGMTHAGYEQATALPIVYLVSDGEFRKSDAVELVTEVFPTFECRVLVGVVCFEGRVSRQTGVHQLKDFMNPIPMGAAMSIRGAQQCFSAGLVVCSLQPPNKRFLISVHHGVSNELDPITPSHPMPMIQPSQLDLNDRQRKIEERIAELSPFGRTL